MKKIIIVLVLLLSIILLGLGIFMINNKTNSNEPKKKQEDIIGDISDEERSTLLEKINNIDNYLNSLYPIDDFNKLTSSQKTNFLLNVLNTKENQELTIKELEKESKNWFETYEPFKNNTEDYSYKNNKYKKTDNNKELTILSLPFDIEIKEKLVIIEKTNIYLKRETNKDETFTINIFKSYEDYKNNNSLKTLVKQSVTPSEEELQDVIPNLNKYTYTFKRLNKKLVPVSVKTEQE